MEKAGTMFRPFLIFTRFVFYSLSFQTKKMNLNRSFFFRVSLLGLFVCGMASCASDRNVEEEVLENEYNLEEEEIQLLEIGIQQMQSWASHWKSNESAFSPSDFSLDKRVSVDQLEWPEENYIDESSPFYPYLIPNPEGRGVVDIYSYKIVFPEQGGPFLNPDSEVIYFRNDGMRERLLFMGPSGGFEDAVWVTPEYLLVSGFFEEEEGITPKLWLIDVKNSVQYIFKHPLVTTNYSKDGFLKKKLSKIDF